MVLAKNQRIVPVEDPAPGSGGRWLPVTWLLPAVVIVLAGCGAKEAGQAGPASWEDDLQPITAADWERGGVHPERDNFTMTDAVMQVGLHDLDHLEQITRVLAQG